MAQQDTQSEERLVAVHPMQFVELNVNTKFAEDLVSPFLSTNLTFSYAINLSREIINGYKYQILFVTQNDSGDEIYCAMDVIEKPWLMNFRQMTFNNCSLPEISEDPSKYERNPIFINQGTELTQDEVLDLEDQIVTTQLKPRKETTTEQNILITRVRTLDEGLRKQTDTDDTNFKDKDVTFDNFILDIKRIFEEVFKDDDTFRTLMNESNENQKSNNLLSLLAVKLRERIEVFDNNTERIETDGKTADEIVVIRNSRSYSGTKVDETSEHFVRIYLIKVLSNRLMA